MSYKIAIELQTTQIDKDDFQSRQFATRLEAEDCLQGIIEALRSYGREIHGDSERGYGVLSCYSQNWMLWPVFVYDAGEPYAPQSARVSRYVNTLAHSKRGLSYP